MEEKKEIRKGWIKHYRRALDDLKGLTDQEYRYYQISNLLAIWDKKIKLFGTFDARTRIIKAQALPNWSVGKINTTKNSLIRKGAYRKTFEHRLEITNAKYLFGKTKEIEQYLQNTAQNFHLSENNFQTDEEKMIDIRKKFYKLSDSKRVAWDGYSAN